MTAHYRRQHRERAVWPDTSIARAYLVALLKWAATNLEDVDARVVLPVGVVNANELLNVLRALEKARQQTNYPTTETEREVKTNAA
jgi:hypothetical protein